MSDGDLHQPSTKMNNVHNNQPWVNFTSCWAMSGCEAILTAKVKVGEQATQKGREPVSWYLANRGTWSLLWKPLKSWPCFRDKDRVTAHLPSHSDNKQSVSLRIWKMSGLVLFCFSKTKEIVWKQFASMKKVTTRLDWPSGKGRLMETVQPSAWIQPCPFSHPAGFSKTSHKVL